MIGADRWVYKSGHAVFRLRWWRDVLWRIPERATIHVCERWKYGVSRYDAYNFTEYLADAVSAGAYKLFVHAKGFPGVPPHETFDKWLATLLEIRDEFTRPEGDEDWMPSDRAWRLLTKNAGFLWD